MTDLTTVDAFLAAFAERERTGLVDGPPWLREERRGALARFAARGLPTTRDEEWKYTSIAPMRAAMNTLTSARLTASSRSPPRRVWMRLTLSMYALNRRKAASEADAIA